MKFKDALSSWRVLRKGSDMQDAALGAWDDGANNALKFVSYTGEPPARAGGPPVDEIPDRGQQLADERRDLIADQPWMTAEDGKAWNSRAVREDLSLADLKAKLDDALTTRETAAEFQAMGHDKVDEQSSVSDSRGNAESANAHVARFVPGDPAWEMADIRGDAGRGGFRPRRPRLAGTLGPPVPGPRVPGRQR
jgi:hypothetical protein